MNKFREKLKKNKFIRKLYHLLKENLIIPLYEYNMMLHIKGNKPYFGKGLFANQCWEERYPVMKKLIEKERKQGYKLLEIGSWAGHSTILWGKALRSCGMVYCIDTWKGAFNTPHLRGKDKQIVELFNHNVKSSGLDDTIVPIRATSDNVVNMLKDNYYDFVYVDGDHAYSQFRKDLVNYALKVKIGGIIAGDDLDLLPKEVDMNNAYKHKEDDFVLDPKTGKYFHAGICLAISEIFRNGVSMKNGFWAMRKTRTGWKEVVLG